MHATMPITITDYKDALVVLTAVSEPRRSKVSSLYGERIAGMIGKLSIRVGGFPVGSRMTRLIHWPQTFPDERGLLLVRQDEHSFPHSSCVRLPKSDPGG